MQSRSSLGTGKATESKVLGRVVNNALQDLSLLPEQTHDVLVHFPIYVLVLLPPLKQALSPVSVSVVTFRWPLQTQHSQSEAMEDLTEYILARALLSPPDQGQMWKAHHSRPPHQKLLIETDSYTIRLPVIVEGER